VFAAREKVQEAGVARRARCVCVRQVCSREQASAAGKRVSEPVELAAARAILLVKEP